jgi:hypothetical protein
MSAFGRADFKRTATPFHKFVIELGIKGLFLTQGHRALELCGDSHWLEASTVRILGCDEVGSSKIICAKAFAPGAIRASRLQRNCRFSGQTVRACAGESAPWAHDVQPLTIVGKWHGASPSSSKRIGKSVGRQPIATIHS